MDTSVRFTFRFALLFAALAAFVTAAAHCSAAQPAENGSHVPAYPLKVSANHRYLVDQAGKPFLIVGDTPQGLMGRLSEKDADFYFADREAHGFNALGWIDVMCAGNDYPNIQMPPLPTASSPSLDT